MQLNEDHHRNIFITEAYNGVKFKSENGHSIIVYERGGTYEINVIPKGHAESYWFSVNMMDPDIKPSDMILDVQYIYPDASHRLGQLGYLITQADIDMSRFFAQDDDQSVWLYKITENGPIWLQQDTRDITGYRLKPARESEV